MSTAALPDWVIPPYRGFTADDFFQLNDLPQHTELIDGSLIFVSPQDKWHSRAIGVLWRELERQAPTGRAADFNMAVRLGERQVLEPDVLVVTAEAFDRPRPSTYYFADDVVLAVEVVSPESEVRDRDTKPRRYAAAGIRHFWRVEKVDGKTVVHVYTRDPATGAYGLTGIHHDRLALTVPFELDIDLSAIDRRS